LSAASNWSEHTADLPVHFGKIGLDENTDYHVYDIQHDHYYGIHHGRAMMTRVPKHAIARPLDPSRFSARRNSFRRHSISLRAGLISSRRSSTPPRGSSKLTFSIPCLRDGRIYIYCPEGYDPGECVIRGTREAHETVLKYIMNRVYRLDFTWKTPLR